MRVFLEAETFLQMGEPKIPWRGRLLRAYRVEKGVLEADFVHHLAAQHVSRQNRIRDAHSLITQTEAS
jgi:hypothetical protein